METWQTLVLAFGGNAALLAALGFLGKSLLEKIIIRDTKVFEANLSLQTQVEIDRFKSELARSVESYKIQLKKSEVFFLRELEAASAFSSFFHTLLPAYKHPSMDWDDACEAMATDFGKIELRLAEFMTTHGAVLNDEERAILVDATSDAGYGKFDVLDGGVAPEANQKADEMYEKLKRLEAQLLQRVRAQASL